MPETTFAFAFDDRFRRVAALFGVRPDSVSVTVSDDCLDARFGPWRVVAARANVVGCETTGPYSTFKTIGPAHLSMADRGLTFATNPHRGLCIRFAEVVRGIDPWGLVSHPALTVTVADPDGLASALGCR